MLLQKNWPELLWPGLKAIYNEQIGKHPDVVSRLFNVQTSSKYKEKLHGTGNLGLMTPWAGRTSYEDFKAGYTPEFEHKMYDKGIEIERNLVKFDQYDEIKSRVEELADTAAYTRQYYGAMVFNHATDGGDEYLGIDGQPLCSASHPVSPTDATTWRNLRTTRDLTPANLEDTRTEMMTWTDDKGKYLVMKPDTILVGPGGRERALVIAGSEGKPDVADNDINIWKGKITVIEWQLLTTAHGLPAADFWFLIDSTRQRRDFVWFDVFKNEFDDNIDWDTLVARYRVISMFSRGWRSPRSIFGCYKA